MRGFATVGSDDHLPVYRERHPAVNSAMCFRYVRCWARLRLWGSVLLLAVMLSACSSARGSNSSDELRVVAIDWGQAQTLTAMGVPPVAAGEIESYNTWVGTPKLPASTVDVGLRAQPNLELLAQLDPDLITITSMYAGLKPQLSRIAPVKVIDIYFKDSPVWKSTIQATRALGQAVGHPDAAKRLIRETRAKIAALAKQLPENVPPLLIVQFQDARHVRVYGQGSLIDATLERLGLDNAWHGSTTTWGAALVPLARLASIKHARMVVVEPIPVGVTDALEDSVVWQHLPAVNNHPVLRIPGVWSYGGLPSATRFAQLITDALKHANAVKNTLASAL